MERSPFTLESEGSFRSVGLHTPGGGAGAAFYGDSGGAVSPTRYRPGSPSRDALYSKARVTWRGTRHARGRWRRVA
jgi:hypothetical protein